MKDSHNMANLKSRALPSHPLHEVNTMGLSQEDLAKASGGQACASGGHYDKVTLSMRKAGSDRQAF
jgi:hypothetical protein